MKRPMTRNRSKRHRGVAAVELALLLPVMFFLLTFPIFFGRYFWHYTVVHKAANDAARYLSTITEAEMRTPELAEAASAVAMGIAREEIADLNPGPTAPKIAVFCGPNEICQGVESGDLPETVLVTVEVNMFDTIFRVYPAGPRGLRIKAVVEMPYVAN